MVVKGKSQLCDFHLGIFHGSLDLRPSLFLGITNCFAFVRWFVVREKSSVATWLACYRLCL